MTRRISCHSPCVQNFAPPLGKFCLVATGTAEEEEEEEEEEEVEEAIKRRLWYKNWH